MLHTKIRIRIYIKYKIRTQKQAFLRDFICSEPLNIGKQCQAYILHSDKNKKIRNQNTCVCKNTEEERCTIRYEGLDF